MIEEQFDPEQENMELLRKNLSDPKMDSKMNNFQFSVNINLSDPQMIVAFGRLIDALAEVFEISNQKKKAQ